MHPSPDWWNPAHAKFRADSEKIKGVKKILLVNDLCDTVIISRHRKTTGEWMVEYSKVIPGRNDSFHRIIHMTKHELESAFGLTERPKNEAAWSERFGLEAGVEGCFARVGNFLNLPNPNISAEKDSSISILLTPTIKKKVENLLLE